MNEKWECYLCGHEDNFDNAVSGFLGNYHPLCEECADKVIDGNHPDNFRVTYHHQMGNLEVIANIPISKNSYNLN